MAYQGIEGDIQQVAVEFAISGLPVSLCSIQKPDGNTGPSGAPSRTYVAVPGLQNLVCMDAPLSPGGITAMEQRFAGEVESTQFRHLTFTAYYPLLSPSTNWGNVGWQAVCVNEQGQTVTYDIMGAENDSHGTMTRLKVRKVTI